ncbi:MAG: hypothetical protein ACREUQ_15070 [Burkholderiales bacterium]
MHGLLVRHTRREDIPALIALQRRIYPGIAPSDFPFARDGIAAEGTPNVEQIVIANLDLETLTENRINGTTIPLYDKRTEVYDNPIEVVSVK